MHSSSLGIEVKAKATALALMLVALWLLMRGYHGLTGDGQIYAFQALARIHPQLATDLYLQNTSQDQFTIFSPLYAWVIGSLGLADAARLLTLCFTAWLLAAAWSLVRTIAGRDAAWLAAASLLIVAGVYGGSGVFRLAEPFMTARLPAEALIVTAMACHVRGRKRFALLLATGALFVHPLIALPGLIFLVCMWLPCRVSVLGTIAALLATLAGAGTAALLPADFHVLTVMDAAWLQVVRERSQFLFLPLWSMHDWDVNAQPFLYLAFTAMAVPDSRIRKLCLAATLVGASGLAVALIGNLVGPVAILVQGQAWRWEWVTLLISVVLLPVTALQIWRNEKCGPLCTILLVSGWTFAPADGTACALLALALWAMRTHINARAALYLRWLSAALGIAILMWMLTESWGILRPPTPPTGRVPLGAAQIRDIFGLRISAVLAVVLIWELTRSSRTLWVPVVLCSLLAASSICILPAAFRQSRTPSYASEINEFSDWTNVIPPTSTVLVVPAPDVGAFVWFTLQRPNYLSVDQSAGVVFSRATSIEVDRRSEVLLPLMDPNWKILTSLRAASENRRKQDTTRPLTAQNLIQICTDPLLGFVISSKDVGFSPIRHESAGAWKDWYLYDCRKVRAAASAT